MTRLFIGTFIAEKDQQNIGQLPEANPDLEETWRRKVRWVKPEKLHMTWVFLGSIGGDLVQPVSDMINNLVTSELSRQKNKNPIKLVFDHPEIWPDSRKPRQIVLRPTEVDERIMKIASVLRTGLLEFYFEQSQKEETRIFKPHLTLLRLERRQESKLVRASAGGRVKLSDLRHLEDALPVVMTLDKIALIESHMGKQSGYKILHEVATVSTR